MKPHPAYLLCLNCMRVRILISMLVLVFVLPVHAQKEETEQILQEVNLDSLLFTTASLTGIEPVLIDGQMRYIGSRHKDQPGNEYAGKYLENRLLEYGYQTSFQYFGTQGENVVGIKEGNAYPNRAFVICAHYDAIAVPFESATGADDNASGCAAVMEAARLLKDSDYPFTLLFLFFDEEEQGLIGSEAFNQQFDFDTYTIEAVFNLDMIAYDDNGDFRAEIHTRPHGNSQELAYKLAALKDTFDIGLDLEIIDPGTTASDHDAFWQHDRTAILLIEDKQDFNRYYHTKFDSMQYFHDSFFYRNTQLAIAGLVWFASNPDQDLAARQTGEARFRLYPNPAKEQVVLDVPETGIWEIYGLDGKLLATGSVENGLNRIFLNDITPPCVLVRFTTESGKHGTKMLVLTP